MAINKKLIHFKNFSDFNSKKLSANENNTQYTLGVDGEVQTGSPDILYQSICWIKDTKQQWTHGQLYDGKSTAANVQAVDTSETLDDVNGNTYVKYVAQTLTNEQKAQARENINALSVNDARDLYISKSSLIDVDTSSVIDANIFIDPADGLSYGLPSMSEHCDDVIATKNTLKTINGNSILGSGNITIEGGENSIYVTEFTLADCDAAIANGENMQITSSLIWDAVVANKIIFIPRGNAGGGCVALSSISDDYVYLTCVDNYNSVVYYIEVTLEDIAAVDSSPWRFQLKTINGQSLFGSNNIDIGSGEMNVQSDWLESSTNNDSYVRNRTHYVEGTKITSTGNHSIGVNTPIYFKNKLYNLEVGVRTQLATDSAGVYVTLYEGGILNVESFGNYLNTFPIIAVSEIVPIDDMFIPETIVRTSELKTINGQSLIGDGNITISGEEDIRYFTEFTLTEFIIACNNADTLTSAGLYNAIINNKIICIPSDNDSGYTIVRSSYTAPNPANPANADTFSAFELSLEYYQSTYLASTSTNDLEKDTLEGSVTSRTPQVFSLSDPIVEWNDNCIYYISNVVDELTIPPTGGGYGTTIKFKTGENTVITFYANEVLWPNGVMPEIEPYTSYELSFCSNTNDGINAVLVPFKTV